MSSIQLSERAHATPALTIRKLAPLAEKAIALGKKVYHLNIGQPDIKTPVEFFDGIKAFSSDVLHYDSSQGNESLRSAWSNYLNRDPQFKHRPRAVFNNHRASEAIIFTFMICCDPGDNIITFDPSYSNFIGFAAVAGIKLVPVVGSMEENFALPSSEKIEASITNRTRAILLCNPNNPTGTVYTREEVKRLLDICNERNLFLIADETYREFVYDGAKPLSGPAH